MGDAWQNLHVCARLKCPVSGSCLQLQATSRDPLPWPATPATPALRHRHEPPTKETGLGHLVPSPIAISPLFLWSRKRQRGQRQDQTQRNGLFIYGKEGALQAQRAGEGAQEGFQHGRVCARGQEGTRGSRTVVDHAPQVVGSTKGLGDVCSSSLGLELERLKG